MRKQGIKLGFYYSQDQDWTAPGGAAYQDAATTSPVTYHWDKAQDGDFATYLHTKAIPQIKELLSNYGDFPAVIWFDTPTSQHDARSCAAEIVALLNQHPNLIWNNRLGGGYKGDTETPEQFIPPQGYPGRDWESCMTMNDTWGYKSYDTNFKSTETLMRNLIDIASKGGNYLLNIGPDSHGIVPPAEVERLRQVGKWIARQWRSHLRHPAHTLRRGSRQLQPHRKGQERQAEIHLLHGTGAPPPPPTKSTSKSSTGPAALPSGQDFPRNVTRAYLLADKTHKPLKLTKTGEGLDVQLPAKALDPIATVLVLNTN